MSQQGYTQEDYENAKEGLTEWRNQSTKESREYREEMNFCDKHKTPQVGTFALTTALYLGCPTCEQESKDAAVIKLALDNLRLREVLQAIAGDFGKGGESYDEWVVRLRHMAEKALLEG